MTESNKELENTLISEHRWRNLNAKAAKYLEVSLTVIGIFCSGYAGIRLGYDHGPFPAWFAFLAGAPALTTVLQDKLQLKKRDQWHTRFAEECVSLLQRLRIEGEDTVSVSRALRELRTEMTARWERTSDDKREPQPKPAAP